MLSNINIDYTERHALSILSTYSLSSVDISEEDFITEESKVYYRSIKSLLETKVPVNARTLFMQLQKVWTSIKYEEVSKLLSINVPVEEHSFILQQLKENRHKDIIQNLVIDLTAETAKKSDINWDKISELGEKIQYYKTIINNEESSIEFWPKLVEDYKAEIDKRELMTGYWDTGCSLLNSVLFDGFLPGTITTVAGSPGTGKSTAVLYLVNKQVNKQIPSLYCSLEMPKMSVLDKIMGQRLNTELKNFRPRGEEGIDEETLLSLNKEFSILESNLKFGMVSGRSLSLSELESLIVDFKKKTNSTYAVVTVDLVTMIHEFNKSASKANDYEHAENILHAIASRQNVHIVQVVQLKRPADKVNIKTIEDIEKLRPTKEMIKNSGGIEERSRTILGVHFPLNHAKISFGPDDPYLEIMDSDIEIQILKQNMGEVGKVLYYDFCPEKSRLMPVHREQKMLRKKEEDTNKQ